MVFKTLLPLSLVVLAAACSHKDNDQNRHDNNSTSPIKVEQPKSAASNNPDQDTNVVVETTDDKKTTKQDEKPNEIQPSVEPELAAQAVNGAIDSSGGNLTSSTESQVRLFLQRSFLTKFLITAVSRLEIIKQNDEDTALLTPLLQGSAKVSAPIKSYIRSLDLETIEETNCLDSHTGEMRDASVTASGRLCFDVKRMQRIPFQSLQLEIVALVLHEIAHVYGYSEEESVAVQNLVRSQRAIIFPDQRTIETVESDLQDIRRMLMEVEIDLNLDEGARTHAHICSNIGMATGMAQSWRSMFEYTVGGIVYGDALFINDQPTYLPRRDELVTLSTELIHLNRNYCLFVPDQTKEEFLEKLIQTKTQLEDLLKTVSLFVNS